MMEVLGHCFRFLQNIVASKGLTQNQIRSCNSLARHRRLADARLFSLIGGDPGVGKTKLLLQERYFIYRKLIQSQKKTHLMVEREDD
ncbi:hypothetical protein OWV82_006338 [Melia azedarach]|uniref:Uncharacterized protein n=1 Tax=Melia azedarach TaxID=155640 RepID=A0ACC1YHE9_MELAZ|nr:hypothetical protein OWV82_006338 [Melia azedarach]